MSDNNLWVVVLVSHYSPVWFFGLVCEWDLYFSYSWINILTNTAIRPIHKWICNIDQPSKSKENQSIWWTRSIFVGLKAFLQTSCKNLADLLSVSTSFMAYYVILAATIVWNLKSCHSCQPSVNAFNNTQGRMVENPLVQGKAHPEAPTQVNLQTNYQAGVKRKTKYIPITKHHIKTISCPIFTVMLAESVPYTGPSTCSV